MEFQETLTPFFVLRSFFCRKPSKMKRKAPQTVTLEVYKRPRTQEVVRQVVRAQPMQIQQGPPQRAFVPRSLGTPLAITERKYFDAALAATAIPVGLATAAAGEMDPAANTLFSPTTGDDFNNRTGRKCQVLKVKVKGNIAVAAQADQTAMDVAGWGRIVLVQDMQTNAAQLNSEDVINVIGIFGYQNPAFFGRFRVLKDKTFRLPMPQTSWDGTNIEQAGFHMPFKMSHNFKKPVTVHFNATNGGTVADIVDNSFHVLAFVSTVALAPTLQYHSRVIFADI